MKTQTEAQPQRIDDQVDPNAALDPQVAAERDEDAGCLQREVARLPDQQQEVLRLKFNAGLSYREIAKVTGLSRSHVGVTLHHAIAKLRQRMA